MTGFLFSLVLGAVLSLFYDMIRATRVAGLNSTAAVFIGDILFWLICAVAVFIFLVGVTNGEIRGYVLFSAAIGFIVYRVTAGRLLFRLLCLLIGLLRRAAGKISAFADKLYSEIERFAAALFKRVRRVVSNVFAALKKLLKNMRGLLYTIKVKKGSEKDTDE